MKKIQTSHERELSLPVSTDKPQAMSTARVSAILLPRFGEISNLEFGEIDRPKLAPNQVRIRVHASGLNRADLVQRRGHYPPPPGESEILGLEVAGEIAEVGAEARGWKIGDRAMALLAGGGYAQEAVVDAALAMPIPRAFSFEQAAAIPEVFLTAHHNLFTMAGVQVGETALIHAGASGVGTAGIQLLKVFGAQAIVTAGGAEKCAACRALGAIAIDYKSEDFAESVKRETGGRGVNVILDPVGASHFEKNTACLSLGARWVFIGTMGGTKAELDLRALMGKRARLIGSTLRALPLAEKRAVVERFRTQFLAKFDSGELKPIVDQVFPAREVRAAHEHMEANRNVGKIILTWS